MKWLVSCFEPFESAKSNSSAIVCSELRKLDLPDIQFVEPLPVTFADCWPRLQAQIGEVDGILALGQAEGRRRISLECIGLNWIDARIPDNNGEQPRLVKVSEGPEVLWSQIPWDRIGESEVFERSYSAGTFVCNQILYQINKWARNNGKLGGFVHIPVLASQTEVQLGNSPKMEDRVAVEGLATILRFLTELKP
jgi:pyroglutamyl-peptidase